MWFCSIPCLTPLSLCYSCGDFRVLRLLWPGEGGSEMGCSAIQYPRPHLVRQDPSKVVLQ